MTSIFVDQNGKPYKLPKTLTESLKAHNMGKKEAVYNDNYNKAYGLGTWLGRRLMEIVAQHEYGMFTYGKKITQQQVVEYLVINNQYSSLES